MNKILYKSWFGIIIIGLVIIVIWNISTSTKELRENGILMNAELIDVVTTYRGTPKYQYKFYYKGKFYIENDASGVQKLNIFIGKTFPIIYSPKSNRSHLLMTPADFEKFGIPFPDSLRWVLEYQNN